MNDSFSATYLGPGYLDIINYIIRNCCCILPVRTEKYDILLGHIDPYCSIILTYRSMKQALNCILSFIHFK